MRGQLLQVLAGQSLQPEKPRISAIHSIHVNLTFVDIAIAELAPQYMRGYGPVSDTGMADLNGIVAELQSAIKELTRYVLQPRAGDLQERVQKLASPRLGRARLASAGRNYRSAWTDRIPADHRHAARSSRRYGVGNRCIWTSQYRQILLVESRYRNRSAASWRNSDYGGTDAHRIRTETLIRVWHEGLGVSEHTVEELPRFVDERLNPENRKRVGRILVLYPSERLREGIVLVDTPGLGSLATSGASETLAYLPRCDAAIVLVDSSSILTGDDLKIIAALNQVSTPTTVLVSKADLLSPQDLEQQLAYTKRQLQSEYGSEVPVRAVSVVASHTHLLQQWFTDELSPLYERKQRLLQESLARKTLMLGMAVRTALDMAASQPTIANEDRARLEETDLALQRGAGTLQTFQVDLRRITDEIPLLKPLIVNKAADEIADLWVTEREVNCGEKLRTTADEVLREMTAEVRSRLEDLQTGLQRELSKAAAVLRTTDAPNAEDLHAGIEMPVFHMNRTGELASRSWVSHLGKWARVARARRELRPLENGLNEALESFSRLLCAWGLDEGAEMGTRFDSFANRYRVQLERLLIDRRRPTASQEQVKSDRERLTGMIAPDLEKPRTEAIAS